MEERNKVNREDLLLAEQAAEWLHRLENATPQDRAAFVAWLKESPKHVREILLAATWDEVLNDMDPERRIDVRELVSTASRNVVPVQGSLSQAGHRMHGEPSWPRKAGLGLAAAVVVAVGLFFSGALNSVLKLNEYSTDIGEQRSIQLPDGSLVSLNTRSTVRIELSDDARDMYLNEGQAMFVVAHDKARPFRVHVGNSVVKAVGTKFDIRRREDRTDVAVVEGIVSVGAPERARLTAGNGLSIAADGQVTAPTAVDVAMVTAWQQRRIVFDQAPLAEVADEFNRYNSKQRVRVEGDALRAKPFTLSMDADTNAFVKYLQTRTGIVVERDGDDFVVRASSVAAP